MSERGSNKVTVTEGGPYLVEDGIPIHDHEGNLIAATGSYYMCRCGGSKTKPFCDGTHKSNNFNGQEFASRGAVAERREAFVGTGVTILDDRSLCAHAGNCTNNLSSVFSTTAEPWVHPKEASAAEIARVIATCPSGALRST